jgi:PIN domain nuclease of toxin-antitoxin system
MKILLDTHIFLWYIAADTRLMEKYVNLIIDTKNDIYISVASIWECTIKQQIGKLNFPDKAAKYLTEKRELHLMKSLSIDENCIKQLANLESIHKDPFDRIIISQALEYNLKLITEDSLIKKYELKNLIL